MSGAIGYKLGPARPGQELGRGYARRINRLKLPICEPVVIPLKRRPSEAESGLWAETTMSSGPGALDEDGGKEEEGTPGGGITSQIREGFRTS